MISKQGQDMELKLDPNNLHSYIAGEVPGTALAQTNALSQMVTITVWELAQDRDLS